MAAKLGGSGSSSRRRVFVLVDKGEAQGVFTSWDAAETYADGNRFSLDRLLEYETRSDHPDHLHLMAGQWDGTWKYIGEWRKKPPNWDPPPERIRLDHYHALGDKFHLLRQKDFKWREGVLDLINPMAPDAALQIDSQIKTIPAPVPQWKPKISPLKPISSPVAHKPEQTEHSSSPKPLIDEPEPPMDEPSGETPKPVGKIKPKLATSAPFTKEVPGKEPRKASGPSAKEPRVSLSKRKPLRLKTDREGPKPIPDFKTATSPPATMAGLPGTQPGGSAIDSAEEDAAGKPGKVKKVWPMRLIIAVMAIFVCWGGGIYWVLKPPATTQSIVSEITSLANARVIPIEPGQIFFQLDVDPVHQQRWVRSLGLLPIPYGKTFTLPQYHALDTWEKPEGFIRPPYAEVEVREWWNIRLRKISYGFFYQWEDGSILILDLQSDLLLGWGRARHLPELMN